MSAEPLDHALREIAPKLDPSVEPLVKALLDGDPVEEAWRIMLEEVLNEA